MYSDRSEPSQVEVHRPMPAIGVWCVLNVPAVALMASRIQYAGNSESRREI